MAVRMATAPSKAHGCGCVDYDRACPEYSAMARKTLEDAPQVDPREADAVYVRFTEWIGRHHDVS